LATDLDQGPIRVDLEGEAIVVVRDTYGVHALGAVCSHLGGPLDEGELKDGCLVCPWHGSEFDVTTGAVVRGPATMPQPRYEARIEDGRGQVRAREGGGGVRCAGGALPPPSLRYNSNLCATSETGGAGGRKCRQRALKSMTVDRQERTLSKSSENLPQGAAGDSHYSLGDSIYNRLLKERIIWLGSDVRDDNANQICAQ